MAGDADVVNAARSTVAHDWRANARTRLGEMHESVVQRHARQGDLAHLIEPDLKEAHGGLRDMSVLRALTAAWLTDRPHGEVDEAYERILDVRDAIHVATGRGRDRLTRDDQDACAALLGYTDSDDLLTDLSTSARTIAYAVDGTIRRAMQSQRARTLRVGPRRPQLAPLGYGLYRHDGEAVLGPSADLSSDPIIPLRAAVVAARGGIPLSPTTLKNLSSQAPPMPEPWPEVARNLFADLLAAGPGLVTVWEGLDLAGVVERWIPEWSAVRSRPQRNAVHRHTVDRHLIETVVAASGMVRDVARPDLLMLASVLHDIGKVPGSRDHAVTGAEIADGVLRRMGASDADRTIIVRLVREHLTLVDLATRRDPEDPATIAALSEAVDGSVTTLDLLRALTEADASAAGPKAWSDWRAGLVSRLHTACRAALIAQSEGEGALVVEPIETLPLSEEALDKVASGEPYVTVSSLGGAHRIDIIARDRAGLFADTAGLLAAHGFIVRSAIVRTVDGLAVNEWWVDSPGGETPAARDHLARPVAGGRRRPFAAGQAPAAQGRRSPQPRLGLGRLGAGHGDQQRLRHRDRHRGARHRPTRPAAGHRHDARPGLAVGAVGAHRHVCRPDPRHVLRDRVRWRAARTGPGRTGRRDDHRHLRRLIPSSTRFDPPHTPPAPRRPPDSATGEVALRWDASDGIRAVQADGIPAWTAESAATAWERITLPGVRIPV